MRSLHLCRYHCPTAKSSTDRCAYHCFYDLFLCCGYFFLCCGYHSPTYHSPSVRCDDRCPTYHSSSHRCAHRSPYHSPYHSPSHRCPTLDLFLCCGYHSPTLHLFLCCGYHDPSVHLFLLRSFLSTDFFLRRDLLHGFLSAPRISFFVVTCCVAVIEIDLVLSLAVTCCDDGTSSIFRFSVTSICGLMVCVMSLLTWLLIFLMLHFGLWTQRCLLILLMFHFGLSCILFSDL